MEYTPYTTLYNFPSCSDLETVSNPQYEKKIETMFDDLIDSYREIYDIDTGNISKKKEQRETVRKNINSTIDPRKI
jgi:hypothetical protein